MTSIFQLDVIEQQTSHENEALAAEAKKQKTINEARKELTSIFHNIHKDEKDKEIDWNAMLRNAQDQAAQWKVMAARDAYLEEQKVRAFEEQQAAFDSRVDRLLATPQNQRNKFWYEELKKNDPNAFWDSRVQKARQKDREVLKLAFHLKAR